MPKLKNALTVLKQLNLKRRSVVFVGICFQNKIRYLPTRSLLGGSQIINTPEKIAAGRGKLTLARNIGVKGLQEIARALNKLGYIEDIKMWLQGK